MIVMAENPLQGLLSLLNNEIVQGVAGAAAFGVNPALGLLAAPLLRNRREARSLEMEGRRAELREMNRRRQSVDRLQGLLAATGVPPERANADVPRIQTPEGQRQALGLLADISPNVAAQGVIGMLQPQRPTSFMREAEAAGFVPGTPEYRELLVQRLTNGGNPTDDLIQRTNLMMAQLQLEQMRSDREQRERTEAQSRAGRRQAIRRNFNTVESLAGLNQNLQNTALESGLPAPDLRRDALSAWSAALTAAGVDQTERRQQISDFDSLRKGFNELVIQTLDRFGGTITNDKLRVLQNASASNEITPQATASILADIAEINLDQAAIEGVRVENPERVRRFISDQRAFASGLSREPDSDEGDLLRRFEEARDASSFSDEEILRLLRERDGVP